MAFESTTSSKFRWTGSRFRSNNLFVFVGGRFAGTLSPVPMTSRRDGSAGAVRLAADTIAAEFVRYREQDPDCCPTSRVTVRFRIDRTGAQVVIAPVEVRKTRSLVFDANGTMLRIAKVGKLTPAPYTVLGWEVGDIRGTVTELRKRGVIFETIRGFEQDDLGVWTAPDKTKIAWFRDPDGNMLSVTQFP